MRDGSPRSRSNQVKCYHAKTDSGHWLTSIAGNLLLGRRRLEELVVGPEAGQKGEIWVMLKTETSNPNKLSVT